MAQIYETDEEIERVLLIGVALDDNDEAESSLDELAELAKTVGFDIKAPTVPAGYEADAYIDISGELAEVFYVKGDDTLVYRVSRGEGDNSGDYNTYSNKKTVDVNGVSVELRGKDKVNVATWSNGGFAYSVSAKQGISETEVAAVVSSVF